MVEDNDDDVFALRWAMKKAGLTNQVRVVTDGQQALDYLSGAGKYADRDEHPIPALVFLDLKLPFLNGHDVLRWLRSQAQIGSLPVVILTGSDETRDHERSRESGATAYLVKPPEPEDLRRLVESL